MSAVLSNGRFVASEFERVVLLEIPFPKSSHLLQLAFGPLTLSISETNTEAPKTAFSLILHLRQLEYCKRKKTSILRYNEE